MQNQSLVAAVTKQLLNYAEFWHGTFFILLGKNPSQIETKTPKLAALSKEKSSNNAVSQMLLWNDGND